MTMLSLLDTTNLLPTLGESGGLADGLWHKIWMRDNAGTSVAAETDVVFMGLFWFCVFWFVLLMVLMLFWTVKYSRRRVGQVAPVSASHNRTMEVIWTVVPSLCLIPMFVYGYRGYIDKTIAPGDALEMRLTGYKWNWSLVYPGDIETPTTTVIGSRPIPVFYMPAGRAIKFRMLSNDVMHAFWVPDFRIKQDVLPNRYMSVWFQANQPTGEKVLKAEDVDAAAKGLIGTPYEDHWVFCAEYCGDEHSEMAAILRVVPEDRWTQWLGDVASWKSDSLTAADRGALLFKGKGCISCHSVDGSKNTGPTWKELYLSKQPTDKGEVTADADYIRESIRVPAAKVVTGYPNQMTPYDASQISEKQVDDLIAYMKTLSSLTPAGELEAATAKPKKAEGKADEKK